MQTLADLPGSRGLPLLGNLLQLDLKQLHRVLANCRCDRLQFHAHVRPYLIGGLSLDDGRISIAQLIRELQISQEAAARLIDTLVTGGYLQRSNASDDKFGVTLTARSRFAAEVQRTAAGAIETQLVACVGAEAVRTTRRTLAVLIDLCRRQALMASKSDFD